MERFVRRRGKEASEGNDLTELEVDRGPNECRACNHSSWRSDAGSIIVRSCSSKDCWADPGRICDAVQPIRHIQLHTNNVVQCIYYLPVPHEYRHNSIGL